MQLTTRTDNAIRIMLYLAGQMEDRWVAAPEIGSAINSSSFIVQKIVLDLANAGLLRTARGRYGGIKLARDIDQVQLSEVVAVGERDSGWRFTECDRRPDCPCYLSGGNCTLRAMYKGIQNKFMDIFSEVKLGELRTTETDNAARNHADRWRQALRAGPKENEGSSRRSGR